MTEIKLWGTRGSLASPGPETNRYGGNTACVTVQDEDSTTLMVLDAGSGIRRVGAEMAPEVRRVDILLTHLHLDHILGLGFFAGLYNPQVEVHIWGPPGVSAGLEMRLKRYLSPPLFPLHMPELPAHLVLHEVVDDSVEIGPYRVQCSLVCHPGPTLAYRIQTPEDKVLTYMPDHEPALGIRNFPHRPEWTSGYRLAEGADLLIHDAQYSVEEYGPRQGWGHCTVEQALAFGALCGVAEIVPFHYDPAHDDDTIDAMMEHATRATNPAILMTPGKEGATFTLR